MALPTSGAISFSAISVELGLASNSARSLNDSAVRSLFEKVSGAISMSDGYGKSSIHYFDYNPVISANTTNYNMKAAAIAAGWNQSDVLRMTVTINSGVIIYSTSTGSYAFDTGSTFPAGSTLALINNGTILGCGGAGADGPAYVTSYENGLAGAAGGPAFIARNGISVTNNGIIGGGGGGGGSGGSTNY